MPTTLMITKVLSTSLVAACISVWQAAALELEAQEKTANAFKTGEASFAETEGFTFDVSEPLF